MGGLCNGKLGEKFNEVFSELMEGDLSKACRFPSMMMVVMMKGDLSQSITPNLALCRATHGITVDVPALRTAYALPVPKQRSVFSYQLVSLPPSYFGQPSDALWLWQVIHNKAEWTKWEDILNTNASLPRDVYAGNMIIPTLDTVR